MTPDAVQGVEGFLVALFFGAVSVWLHAINQFNRSTYDQSKEFYRLLDKLRPSDLRKSDVYRQAFLFYAVILTLVYLAVVAFLTVPGLQQFAELIPGLSSLGQSVGAGVLPQPDYVAGVAFDEGGAVKDLAGVDPGTGYSAAIPLAVGLAVVGLAPNVPGLLKLEQFVRATAHQLSGIPTHLVTVALALRHKPLLTSEETGQGLQKSDWDRIRAYSSACDQNVENAERFTSDATKIIILRRWILEQAVFAPYLPISTKYRIVEADVRARVNTLVAELDRVSGYATEESGISDGPAESRVRPDWSGLIAATEDTVEDLCLLVVLYEEHQALQIASQGADETEDDERLIVARRYLASVSGLMEQANIDNIASALFSRLTLAILLMAVVGSLIYGWVFLAEGFEPGWRTIGLAKHALAITLSTAVTYVPALFFTLTFQQSRYVSVPPVWENAFTELAKRSRFVPQLMICGLIALFVAFFFRIGYHLYVVINAVGLETVRERLWQVIDFAVVQELTFALQGSAVAVTAALIIDCWRAGRLALWRWWFIGALATLLSAIAMFGLAAQVGWSCLGVIAERPSGCGLTPTWRLAVDTALPALLTGTVAAIYAVGFLRDEFPDVYQRGVGRPTTVQ